MDEEELKEYRKKRDFEETDEPTGQTGSKEEARPIFVIQEHDASNRHFDFRLQVGEVLVSWAVPKGPSTDPSEKRLALRTEDHPLGYADFEGTIPEGEYGAGRVIVWDRGPYRNLKEERDLGTCIEEGHLTVWLEGEKLKGGYALTHTGTPDEDGWILVKMDDEEADARRKPVSTEPESVLSGKSIEDIEKEEGSCASGDV